MNIAGTNDSKFRDTFFANDRRQRIKETVRFIPGTARKIPIVLVK